MARTIAQIQAEMIANVQANPTLSTKLTSTSNMAVWRLSLYVVAVAIWGLEVLLDLFRDEITAEMALQKPHTKDWYRNKVLGFLLGVPVIPDTDVFDTTGMTDEQIEAAKVIKQAATVKLISANGYGILRIKIATADANGVLQPVPELTFNACKAYMLDYVVDAGTQVQMTTGVADQLKADVDVYFDNLVLDPQGQRLDGTSNTPVQDAITAFLQSITFNGVLNTKELEMAISAVPGVRYANVKYAASKYGGYTYEQAGINNVGVIDVFRVADSGYFIMDALQINWLQHEQ